MRVQNIERKKKKRKKNTVYLVKRRLDSVVLEGSAKAKTKEVGT